MTVYVVGQLDVTDPDAYDRYRARFRGVLAKFDGRLTIPQSSKDIGREIRSCCYRLQMRWHFTGSGSPLITWRSSRTGMPGPVPTYCWSTEFLDDGRHRRGAAVDGGVMAGRQ
jgi:hypothetical protein